MKAYATLFLTAWALFLVLTAPSWQASQVAAGALVALAAAVLTRRLLPASFSGFPLKSVFRFLLYIPVFLWEMVKANLQIALIVLDPRLPVAPRIFKIKTRLTSDGGKMMLANSITLTPGTLTVDVSEDELWIHCVRPTSEQEADPQKLLVPFEDHIGRFAP